MRVLVGRRKTESRVHRVRGHRLGHKFSVGSRNCRTELFNVVVGNVWIL